MGLLRDIIKKLQVSHFVGKVYLQLTYFIIIYVTMVKLS
jgi:hypothetical protein